MSDREDVVDYVDDRSAEVFISVLQLLTGYVPGPLVSVSPRVLDFEVWDGAR